VLLNLSIHLMNQRKLVS